VLVVVFIFVLASCQNNSDVLNSTDKQDVNSVTVAGSYVSEGSDISTNAIAGVSAGQYSGARVESTVMIASLIDRDDRFKCATVTIVHNGTKDSPAGMITITFDPNCSDKHGVKRSGTIVINYSGKRWMPGSYHTVHLDFYRNGIHIEGVDSTTTKLSVDSLHLEFQSVLAGGKVTFHDGKTTTRDHNLVREWFRSTLPMNDEWHELLGGTALGKNKDGDMYQMQITKDLVRKVSCRLEDVFIPVSGTKTIAVTASKGSREYTIDYGDGNCDNTISITFDGKVNKVTVDEDGD